MASLTTGVEGRRFIPVSKLWSRDFGASDEEVIVKCRRRGIIRENTPPTSCLPNWIKQR